MMALLEAISGGVVGLLYILLFGAFVRFLWLTRDI